MDDAAVQAKIMRLTDERMAEHNRKTAKEKREAAHKLVMEAQFLEQQADEMTEKWAQVVRTEPVWGL